MRREKRRKVRRERGEGPEEGLAILALCLGVQGTRVAKQRGEKEVCL